MVNTRPFPSAFLSLVSTSILAADSLHLSLWKILLGSSVTSEASKCFISVWALKSSGTSSRLKSFAFNTSQTRQVIWVSDVRPLLLVIFQDIKCQILIFFHGQGGDCNRSGFSELLAGSLREGESDVTLDSCLMETIESGSYNGWWRYSHPIPNLLIDVWKESNT